MQQKEDHQHTIAGKADRNLGQMETQGIKHGLYNPSHEHDACGIAVLADLKKGPSHRLVADALQALVNLEHTGATGGDGKSGDGAGILCQIPDSFFRRVMYFVKPKSSKKSCKFPHQAMGIFAWPFCRIHACFMR